jgi:hypothetical protein
LSSHCTMGITGNPAELPRTRLSSHSTKGTGKPELPWYQGNHGGLVELSPGIMGMTGNLVELL